MRDTAAEWTRRILIEYRDVYMRGAKDQAERNYIDATVAKCLAWVDIASRIEEEQRQSLHSSREVVIKTSSLLDIKKATTNIKKASETDFPKNEQSDTIEF